MTRIGLTQRVEVVEAYDERRDCLDQRWGSLLRSFGYTPIPLFNQTTDVEEYLSELELDGIILTGGNDLGIVENGTNVAPERDHFEQTLLTFAIDRNMPVLGVCRGLQMINVFFDGSLSALEDHVATTHYVALTDPPIEVEKQTVITNSYHKYGVKPDDLSEDLISIGQADDGTIEWFEHETAPIQSIMWHPERDQRKAELDRRIITHSFGTGDQ